MLPSLSALRAFEAAASTGSFRAAAELLSVTPTAISHHIRGLEEQLGTKLFKRSGRDVVLTEDGQRLAETAVQAFGMLEDAVRALRRTTRRTVRIAAGPIFTARWLMPRISNFWEQHPGTGLEVVPTYQPGAQDRENVDIVIRWERMSEMPEGAVKLLELSPVAIASEAFLTRFGPVETPADLLHMPLLHQRNHWGWLDWFSAMGVRVPDTLRGPVFEDANVLLRGAAEGQGVIVGWLPLIDQDLAEDRVVRLFGEDIKPTHGYFLDVRKGSHTRRKTQLAIEWLTAQSTQADFARC
ncbi:MULTISPECIES: LysR substrate-binding domain-containing protein [unclassified Leisingera]|uniref:LysR substrate-binding domain-containing protein n=1 Tax=unclassified Leisingera TaxID=2614906 RepID=UPI0002DFAC23|nr:MULTISPECIES: LysR substrate-binding domain-containing protein [unclassified Leisingera]KIC26892.1 LysR family transcriptional regulator [Leisingera sp. ANG-S3]KIC50586.1 LysR family transcriptional regulator [Leisingera sp. ANG-S]KID07041.1 LysR family transcriptional regulator [Leisingera sp. ANG1]